MSQWLGQSFGRYHILEQLGEGGMAIVFKAYDTQAEHDVAIKVIRRDAFPPNQLDRILKRFGREGMALEKLSHPNIIRVIDHGEHEDSPFLVMEYLAGGTLKEKLGKPMDWINAFEMLIPITRALAYSHKKQIIHRDIKPSNILVTTSGELKLTDFGIAKMIENQEGQTFTTGTGVGIGTPEYMSPEQGAGRDVDERADIYSLGIVLYEMLVGRKPYTADTPMAVIVKHINDPLPRPKNFVKALPENVERILLKALAKDPKNRFKDMSQFGSALEELVQAQKKEAARSARRQETARKRAQSFKNSFQSAGKKLISTGKAISDPKRRKQVFAFVMAVALLASAGYVLQNPAQMQNINFPQINVAKADPTNTELVSDQLSPTSTNVPTPTATPNAYPPLPYAEGKTLFDADFETSSINDFVFTDSPDSGIASTYWKIQTDENGNHYLLADPPSGVRSSFSPLGGYLPHQVIQGNFVIDLKIYKEPGGTEIQIFSRNETQQLPDCTFNYRFSVSRPNIFDECRNTQYGPDKSMPYATWTNLRLEVFNGQIREYWDGELIYTLETPLLADTVITIHAEKGQVLYDDIRIAELVERPVYTYPDALSSSNTSEVYIYDNFNDPKYDGSINPSLWKIQYGILFSGPFQQRSGVLRIEQSGRERFSFIENFNNIVPFPSRKMYVEAEMYMDESSNQGQIEFSLNNNNSFYTLNNNYSFYVCRIWADGQLNCSEESPSGKAINIFEKNVSLGEWYTLRYILDPGNKTISLWVNGEEAFVRDVPMISSFPSFSFGIYSVSNFEKTKGMIDNIQYGFLEDQ